MQRDEIATGAERLLRTALPTDRKRKIVWRHPSVQRDEIATGAERLLRTALPTDRKRKIQTFCGFFGTFKN